MYITQSLKRAMQVNGKGTATIFADRQQTWNQFGGRVARLAGAFQELELSDSGRIAILSLNSDRYLEVFYAVPWAGGIIVPLNTRLAVPELVYMLNDAGAELLIVDDAFVPLLTELKGKLATVRHTIYAGEGPAPDGLLAYETILAAANPIADAERGGDAVAGIFYTGGTTGVPKGVMLTHTNFVSAALQFVGYFNREDPMCSLHAAPMFHIAGASGHICVTMMHGSHMMIPRFDPVAVAAAIQKHQVTNVMLIPTMIGMMVNHPRIREYNISSLRCISYGGAPMPEALIERLLELAPHCKLVQGFGQTETCAACTFLVGKYHVFAGPHSGKTKSCGQALFGLEVKIVDAQDKEVGRGEVGEIAVRGTTVMVGYWNQPEETARVLRAGWLHTGDAGRMDEDGFIYIVDRLKDVIITGGENVYSAEVENVLYRHPAVAMCAVIGIPNEQWGEQVHAVVVPREGQTLTAEDLMVYCKGQIAGFKLPRSFEIRTDPLPISAVGKIQKAKLRAPYWAERERMVN
ncbi:MAG: long-chain-fatty-acid--CoA ligase [Caldilinea sp. CFX5]|nr:long-chain-fatty-acid--CoA ligase [Caldilinea sp. CFX5]